MLHARHLLPAFAALCFLWAGTATQAETPPAAGQPITLETDYVRWVIGPNGHHTSFADKKTGKEYCPKEPMTGLAHARKAGKTYGPVACSAAGDLITVIFGGEAGTVTLKATPKGRYLVLEITAVLFYHAAVATSSASAIKTGPACD